MASTPSNLSAAVTRILSLTGFPKELKTKDIQVAFAEWENQSGGFKIKWIDDTSLYIVFQDATVAKRAYLHTIAFPPASFTTAEGESATIRPYDGPDAQNVIQAINARQHNGARRSASISVPGPRRGTLGGGVGVGVGSGGGGGRHASHASMSIGGGGALVHTFSNGSNNGGPPSPSLPDLPSHPTLDSLIDATLNANSQQGQGQQQNGTRPAIGDPGKRMLGHALGMRHPGLPARNGNGPTSPPGSTLPLAMGGLTIVE